MPSLPPPLPPSLPRSTLLCQFRGGAREKPSSLIAALKQAGALDDKLRYQPGHAIYEEYHDYKAADKKAGQDSTLYRKRVKKLQDTNCLPAHGSRNRPAVAAFAEDANKQLAILAEAASTSAEMYVSYTSSTSRRSNLS